MRKRFLTSIIAFAFSATFVLFAQTKWADQEVVKPRMRVIVDNDFGGDPDGFFHLAEQLLSPSCEVRGIVCSHHYKEFYDKPGNVSYARSQVQTLLDVMKVLRDVYRQCLYSYAELKCRLSDCGKIGDFLMTQLDDILKRSKGRLGEAYVLGDNPLILATALQSAWEADAASTEYVIRKTPILNDRGFYNNDSTQRPMRVFTKVDTRLMLEDLIAKLKLTK